MAEQRRRRLPLELILIALFFLAVALVIGVALIYFQLSAGLHWSDLSSIVGSGKIPHDVGRETLGQFGDFLGGTLNPILSLLALGAILWTIAIQTKELKLTREELKRSAQAQQDQVHSFRAQLDASQKNEKVSRTVRMFERWTSEQMRSHRMLAWSFLEDQVGYGSTEIIRLYEIRKSDPDVNFSISEVNHFLADIKKLLFADLVDENIVESMFKSSLYPWYDFVKRYEIYPPEGENALITEEAVRYRRGVENWLRNDVLGLKSWFEARLM